MTAMHRLLALTLAASWAVLALAGDADEFRIKRHGPFEFAEEPAVAQDGDRVVVRFAAKSACDATVAVEDAQGRIVRHLACGVLGANAPRPFQRDSLKQAVVWDGKNDQGRYIDERAGLTIRVSLGLRPRFERELFCEPRRRASRYPPLMAAAPEGVYVCDGGTGIDQVRLYDHAGDYVRTVYPFPAGEIGHTRGLAWHTFPQDGARLALKTNFLQCTMLTSGTNAWNTQTYKREAKVYDSVVGSNTAHFGMYGRAGSAMAVEGGRLALAHVYLNRLGTDGTTAGLPLQGPKTALKGVGGERYTGLASPKSAALSPDGRWLYLTGYMFSRRIEHTQDIVELRDWRHIPVVMRLDMASDAEAEVFAGHPHVAKHGTDNAHFNVPMSVATDSQGRVYVADYFNDRVQVFAPNGTHVKTIPTHRPAQVAVHRRTGEIYVFSWRVLTQFTRTEKVERQLTRYGPFERPAKIASYPLGLQTRFQNRWGTTGVEFVAALDSWTDPPTIWLVQEWGAYNVLSREHMTYDGLTLLKIEGGKLVVQREFARDVERAGFSRKLPPYHRQRIAVNPATGKLYLYEGDDSAVGKSFREVFEIDPETGAFRRIQMPFNAEDMCFDLDGLAYLRTLTIVARYDPRGWREVPWDYGERRLKVGYGWMSGTRKARLISGLYMPSDGNWHHGGMFVSPKGLLAVGCLYGVTMKVRTNAKHVHDGKKYLPKLFPGRLFGGRGGTTCIHVWDRHGTLVYEDAVPGLADVYGVGIDGEDSIYTMAAATRVVDGTRYYNDMAGTLMKFRPGKGRVLTSEKKIHVPLSPSNYPKRPPDIESAPQGRAWVEGAEWLYGGVGYGGKNRGVGCACWNARFALDYFGRSFAPELDRYSVAVLDANGNLIVRIGRYGNVDDGVPLAGPTVQREPKSVGGDEVALFHGAYLATHTDRRLFIADPGNARVLSVRLGYHASKAVALEGTRPEASER